MAKKDKQQIRYNKRSWLNPLDTSASTGSVVACAGDIKYGKTLYKNIMFLAISSCSDTVRLHRADGESTQDFIDKLKLLEKEIKAFHKYLKETSND